MDGRQDAQNTQRGGEGDRRTDSQFAAEERMRVSICSALAVALCAGCAAKVGPTVAQGTSGWGPGNGTVTIMMRRHEGLKEPAIQ